MIAYKLRIKFHNFPTLGEINKALPFSDLEKIMNLSLVGDVY